MTRYDQINQKLAGGAFILAPLLLVIGMSTYLLGIGVESSYGISSWVEGMFMSFAFLLFVPVYLKLSSLLGQRAPYLGALCAVLSVGIGIGMLPSNARMVEVGLARAGFTVPMFSLDTPGMTPLIIYMGVGMLTSILLGIGFLIKGGLPRWSAVLLILAPIVFIMGQGGDETIAWWQVNIMYPLGTVIWFLALAPIGLQLLGGSAEQATGERLEAAV